MFRASQLKNYKNVSLGKTHMGRQNPLDLARTLPIILYLNFMSRTEILQFQLKIKMCRTY